MRSTGMPLPDIMNALEGLYLEIDRRAHALFSLHAERLRCKQGCTGCCMDGITVFEVEAQNIKAQYEGLLKNDAPAPAGTCAFLGTEGMCRIYPHRPYVCRTQGLPLRWIEENTSGDIVEMRDICPENESTDAIEALAEEQCWTIGPVEIRLAALQALISGNEMLRVPLRSLFKPDSANDTGPTICNRDEPSQEVDIEIRSCAESDEPEVVDLLRKAGLCTADLTHEKLGRFLVAKTEDTMVIGAVGCEAYGEQGLLRSLVVHPAYQGAGLGRILTAAMLSASKEQGIRTLYLLTITASEFFSKLGFQRTHRMDAPPCISATDEFRNLCPVTAVCMCRQIEP
jgi:uncharacterized protein